MAVTSVCVLLAARACFREGRGNVIIKENLN